VFEKYHAYDGKHYLIGSDGKILAAFSKLGISIPIVRRELAKHGIQPPVRKIASLPVRSQVPGMSFAVQKPAAPPPVVWSAPAAAVAGTSGGKLSANLVVTIAPGWYIYALSQKPGGPTPLEITMPATQPFKLGGTIVAPQPDVKLAWRSTRIEAAPSSCCPSSSERRRPGSARSPLKRGIRPATQASACRRRPIASKYP
jgi:hypothetical protein